jgi:hypothetical protein
VWAGGKVLSQEEASAVDSQRQERHVVNLGEESPFHPPERQVFHWSLPMSRDQVIGLVSTYSNVITLADQERRDYLASIARFLDTLEPFTGTDQVDIPMRCLCWRAERH